MKSEAQEIAEALEGRQDYFIGLWQLGLAGGIGDWTRCKNAPKEGEGLIGECLGAGFVPSLTLDTCDPCWAKEVLEEDGEADYLLERG